jgi:hypothetical protein
MFLKYKGSADAREISKKEFDSIGFDHDKVVWDRSNHFTAEVSPEVGQWLLENDKEFKNSDAPTPSTESSSESS